MLILVDNFSTRTYTNEELLNFMSVETANELNKLDAYVVVEEDNYITHATVFDYDIRIDNSAAVSADVKQNLPISTLIKTALIKFKNSPGAANIRY